MSEGCRPDDLLGGRAGWLIWRLPLFLIVVGAIWETLLYWLWIPSFLVSGLGCAWNAARCGRIHCYITGPLYLGAAAYLALGAAEVVPMQGGVLLIVVFGLAIGARTLEGRIGRYRATQDPV